MKAFRILSRNIRDSFQSVFRNFSLSLASISCITITLLVVSISMILSVNVNNFATLVEKDVTIVTFLDANISKEKIKVVEQEIKRLNNIESITFQSKDEITEDMKSSSDTFKSIMDEWSEEENPLQDTYLVKVEDINKIASTAKKIIAIDGVDVIKYGEGMVEQLVSVFDVVRKICLGMVVALIIVTAFLISNTIKITIFSRKREIEIMRLMGVSNWYIRFPLIMQGAFYGFSGAVIALLPLNVVQNGLNHMHQFFMVPTPLYAQTFVITVMFAMAILFGAGGSFLCIKKHLQV